MCPGRESNYLIALIGRKLLILRSTRTNRIHTISRSGHTQGTLDYTQHEVLREFLYRFIAICPDADNKIDPADKKRIAILRAS